MIYAVRGIGKTWIGLSLGLAIANGTDFLAYRVPRGGVVLYWDGEMTVADLKNRLELLGASDVDNLIVMASELLFHESSKVINLNSLDDQRLILRTLEKLEAEGRRPDLVVFDNLSSLGGGVDENDNTALDALLKWLISLRHRGYAVLLIHHAGKSGEQRGASRREDLLDTSIRLEAPKPEDNADQRGAVFRLEFAKTRGRTPEPKQLLVQLRPNENGVLEFTFAGADEAPPYIRTLRTLYEGDPLRPGKRPLPFLSQTEITSAKGVSKGTVSKHIKALRTAALVREDSDGAIRVTHSGVHVLRGFFGDLAPMGNRDTVVDPEQLDLDGLP